jgi:hypothetical protein
MSVLYLVYADDQLTIGKVIIICFILVLVIYLGFNIEETIPVLLLSPALRVSAFCACVRRIDITHLVLPAVVTILVIVLVLVLILLLIIVIITSAIPLPTGLALATFLVFVRLHIIPSIFLFLVRIVCPGPFLGLLGLLDGLDVVGTRAFTADVGVRRSRRFPLFV